MIAWLNHMFSGLDLVFFIMAVFGGLLFIARMALAMIGVGHHDVGGGDVSGDVSVDHGDAMGGADSDASFNMMSVQGLTVFFLIFGLVGLALHRGSGMGEAVSIIGGFLAGVAMMAVLAKLVQLMFRLQTSGNLNPNHAVGKIGTVYLTIPAGGGTGQIQINIDGHLHVYDAVAEEKQAFKTGERVTVTEVIDGRLMVVKGA